jgi:hypothetical protein
VICAAIISAPLKQPLDQETQPWNLIALGITAALGHSCRFVVLATWTAQLAAVRIQLLA